VLTATPVDGSFNPQTVTYSWQNSLGIEVGTTQSITVTELDTYTVIVNDNGCNSESAAFPVDAITCVIQKGISVNNDGLNDTFDLRGFNVKKLTIFNRNGMKVYSRANYTNQWGGQSDNGDDLPDGTYYFVIDRDNAETKTGWIYINRAQ
jgi:gliding motility-associated-like protein